VYETCQTAFDKATDCIDKLDYHDHKICEILIINKIFETVLTSMCLSACLHLKTVHKQYKMLSLQSLTPNNIMGLLFNVGFIYGVSFVFLFCFVFFSSRFIRVLHVATVHEAMAIIIHYTDIKVKKKTLTDWQSTVVLIKYE
jgi:hypothetical protein